MIGSVLLSWRLVCFPWWRSGKEQRLVEDHIYREVWSSRDCSRMMDYNGTWKNGMGRGEKRRKHQCSVQGMLLEAPKKAICESYIRMPTMNPWWTIYASIFITGLFLCSPDGKSEPLLIAAYITSRYDSCYSSASMRHQMIIKHLVSYEPVYLRVILITKQINDISKEPKSVVLPTPQFFLSKEKNRVTLTSFQL